VSNVYRLVWAWLKTNSVLLLNSLSLVGTTVVTATLGFVYWWVAGNQFSPAAMGLGSAEISVMTLLGTICMLGLGTLLISEMPRYKGEELSLISAALITVGGVGWVIGVLFALIVPSILTSFQSLRASVMDVILFACGVSLTVVSLVFDQALIGLLRGELQLWRNSIFALVKLIALVLAGMWLAQKTGMTIYETWAFGNLVSLALMLGYTFLRLKDANRSYRPYWGLLRKMRSAAIQHHVLNLTLQAPALTLPVLVTVLLSTTANAWFYVSWMLAAWGSLLPTVLATVLFATNATKSEILVQKARTTLSLSFGYSVIVTIVILLGTSQILDVFGRTYAEHASWCLRILVLAVFPRTIRDHYVAICRIRGQVRLALFRIIVGGLLELGLATLGAQVSGLLGLSLGFLIALCVEATLCVNKVYATIFYSDNQTKMPIDTPTQEYLPDISAEGDIICDEMLHCHKSGKNR
jgi:O-antigen/teichoic acid export membrane protein